MSLLEHNTHQIKVINTETNTLVSQTTTDDEDIWYLAEDSYKESYRGSGYEMLMLIDNKVLHKITLS